MSKVFVIARKEFGSFFDSLVAYILLAAFLGFSGFFTWIQGSDIFMRREADLEVFFSVARWTLFLYSCVDDENGGWRKKGATSTRCSLPKMSQTER